MEGKRKWKGGIKFAPWQNPGYATDDDDDGGGGDSDDDDDEKTV